MKHILFLASFLMIGFGQAKNCTSSDISKAISSKKRFDFDAEKCTNTGAISVSKAFRLGGGVTVDGKNKMKLNWTGSASKCDEIPRNHTFAVFYTDGNNNVVKNLTIEKSPEGIHLYRGKDNVIENVTFARICEDAITNGHKGGGSATGSIIRNSKFFNAPDKAIQCNGGSVTVQGSTFTKIPRAVAGCTYKADGTNHAAKECPNPCNIKVFNNTVNGCSGGYAFRGSGYLQKKKVGTLTAMNNTIKDCSTPFMAAQYGYVYAEDNTVTGRCDQLGKTEQNSRVELCDNTHSCRKLGSGDVTTKCVSQGTPAPKAEQPEPAPGSSIETYVANGTGGTQQNLSTSEREKLACARASDLALVAARQLCTGEIVEQSSDNCEGKCDHSGGSTTCNATATVKCEYDI